MPIVIDKATTADQIEQLRAYVGDEPVDDALAGMICKVCGGDGGWEEAAGVDPFGPVYAWRPCEACDGHASSVSGSCPPDPAPGEPLF